MIGLFFPLGCFRPRTKKENVLAEVEGTTGPKIFALNQPLLPLKTEPLTLSWSPSSGATSYGLKILGVEPETPLVYERQGILDSFAAIAGLKEGTYSLFVTASDDLGNLREADDNGLTFIVDRSAPSAIVLNPQAISGGRVPIRVAGSDVAVYQYKFGPLGSTDCSEGHFYSNLLSVSHTLDLNTLTFGGHGTQTAQAMVFCLLGLDQAGNRQALGQATRIEWSKEGDLKVIRLFQGRRNDDQNPYLVWQQLIDSQGNRYTIRLELSSELSKMMVIEKQLGSSVDSSSIVWQKDLSLTQGELALHSAPDSDGDVVITGVVCGLSEYDSVVFYDRDDCREVKLHIDGASGDVAEWVGTVYE